MINRIIPFLAVVVLPTWMPALADESKPEPWIELSRGTQILAGGVPITIEGGYPAPSVSDWNGDGKKDLLVGQKSEGRIRIYYNTGTDSEPVFDKFLFLKANGTEISLPSG